MRQMQSGAVLKTGSRAPSAHKSSSSPEAPGSSSGLALLSPFYRCKDRLGGDRTGIWAKVCLLPNLGSAHQSSLPLIIFKSGPSLSGMMELQCKMGEGWHVDRCHHPYWALPMCHTLVVTKHFCAWSHLTQSSTTLALLTGRETEAQRWYALPKVGGANPGPQVWLTPKLGTFFWS